MDLLYSNKNKKKSPEAFYLLYSYTQFPSFLSTWLFFAGLLLKVTAIQCELTITMINCFDELPSQALKNTSRYHRGCM
ncbi:MAG TPA: hypothetical protein DCX53_12630, partial [Anaerolineae bacterium]|nr:hypothetical protein [Anaerolineae bacterium]